MELNSISGNKHTWNKTLSAQGSALRATPANLRCLENTRLRGFSLSEIYVLEQNFSTSFSAFTNRGKLACKFSSTKAIDQWWSVLPSFSFDPPHSLLLILRSPKIQTGSTVTLLCSQNWLNRDVACNRYSSLTRHCYFPLVQYALYSKRCFVCFLTLTRSNKPHKTIWVVYSIVKHKWHRILHYLSLFIQIIRSHLMHWQGLYFGNTITSRWL